MQIAQDKLRSPRVPGRAESDAWVYRGVELRRATQDDVFKGET